MTCPSSAAATADVLADWPRGRREALIPLLQAIQERQGWLSPPSLRAVAGHLELSPAKVYGVATFYNQFRLTAPGRFHVAVCRGTACHVIGSATVLQALEAELGITAGQTSRDGQFSLEVVACLGACSMAPVIAVNGEFHGKLTAKAIPKLVRSLRGRPAVAAGPAESTRRSIVVEAPRRAALGRVLVGMGTCGLAAGAERVRAALDGRARELGLDVRVEPTGCIGFCSREVLVDLAPAGQPTLSYGPVSAADAPALLEAVMVAGNVEHAALIGQHREAGLAPRAGVPFVDEQPFFRKQKRVVLARCGRIVPTSLDEYRGSGGYVGLERALRLSPDEVLREVLDSGLRGRGGGGFPTGRKWQLARAAGGARKHLVCNADEGDPGAFMDRSVLEGDPYAVLEGMTIAAHAVGADEATLYVRAEYPLAVERLGQAIAQAQQAGLLGEGVLGSDLNLRLQVKKGAGAFVCGEETALMASIEGRRGMPRPRPPFPVESGVFGRPTVINNVETFASVPAILRHGAAWYAAMGTATSKGTKVFSVTGQVARPGLVEVPMGTSLREIIHELAGGIPGGRAFKAVQIGGPSGGCVPERHLDVAVDYESLRELGAMMGSGGLVVMDETTCMVDVARFFLQFTTKESCGKCIPCREGTHRLSQVLEQVTTAHDRMSGLDSLRRAKGVMHLRELAEVVQSTSLCGLGQSAPNPLLSTLRHFPEEYAAHVYERRCPARACTGLLSYRIDNQRCSGCGLCLSRCAPGAIVGEAKKAHYIVADKCLKCGQCRQACNRGAVIAS